MKTKRMVCFVIALVLVLSCFTACSKFKEVSLAQQKEDLISCQQVQECFLSEFVSTSKYELVNYQSVKEQINEENKEHIIFSKVDIKNEYFDIVLSVKQEYTFYDKGGWILENCFVEEVEQITPINPPNKELVQSYIAEEIIENSEGYNSVSCEYNDTEYSLKYGYVSYGDISLDEPNIAKQMITYSSDVMEARGYYTLEFTDVGWSFVSKSNDDYVKMIVEDYTADYSQAYGYFELDCAWAPLDPSHYTGALKIHEIKNGYAKYDLEFYLAREADLGISEGDNLTDVFNDFTGEIIIGTYLSGEDIKLRYDCTKDCWTESMYCSFVR